MFYFRRWEQYFQQDAADCHTMIDPSNEKEDVRSTNESKELLYENQDRRVTTSTNAETMFRTWEMPHLQNIDYEDKNKYQFWQDSQHNESYANSFFGENTRAHHREQGNTLVLSILIIYTYYILDYVFYNTRTDFFFQVAFYKLYKKTIDYSKIDYNMLVNDSYAISN